MLLFEHITIAVLFALVIAYFLRGRLNITHIMLASVVGVLLPDIIDKPAYFVFGIGRSIAHSCVIMLLMFLVAYLIFRKDKTNQILAAILFTSAVVCHQIPDNMWTAPQIWFYPLIGDAFMFAQPPITETFLEMLMKELVWSEALLAAASATIITLAYLYDKAWREY